MRGGTAAARRPGGVAEGKNRSTLYGNAGKRGRPHDRSRMTRAQLARALGRRLGEGGPARGCYGPQRARHAAETALGDNTANHRGTIVVAEPI